MSMAVWRPLARWLAAFTCIWALPAATADAAGNSITGTWVSTTGAERLVFLPGGYFRSCFAAGKQGNAAMGQWKRLSAGRYAVEFTHTAKPACDAPPQAMRKHPASIQGHVLVHGGELSLFVSGEFPPDVYQPLPHAAQR